MNNQDNNNNNSLVIIIGVSCTRWANWMADAKSSRRPILGESRIWSIIFLCMYRLLIHELYNITAPWIGPMNCPLDWSALPISRENGPPSVLSIVIPQRVLELPCVIQRSLTQRDKQLSIERHSLHLSPIIIAIQHQLKKTTPKTVHVILAEKWRPLCIHNNILLGGTSNPFCEPTP